MDLITNRVSPGVDEAAYVKVWHHVTDRRTYHRHSIDSHARIDEAVYVKV